MGMLREHIARKERENSMYTVTTAGGDRVSVRKTRRGQVNIAVNDRDGDIAVAQLTAEEVELLIKALESTRR